VVRVGETVRKPWTEHSLGVLAYMRILRDRGVDLPEPIGRDEQGRMITEFVPGGLALHSPALTRPQLAHVGGMVRKIHDASEGLDADELGLGSALIPVADPDLVCHGDLTPWNLILGERWVFIDWDGAAVSTRAWDLAYSAQAFTINGDTVDPAVGAQDLRVFVDGYGADDALRRDVAGMLARRAGAMYELLERSHREGREPWGSMFVEGHGDHWRGIALFLEEHQRVWEDALLDG
jgi:Ser/Thr protein kinase RdoA (MazF antagonist)